MNQTVRILTLFFLLGVSALFSGCTNTYSVDVNSAQKISDTTGNFANNLHDGDHFGHAMATLGDIEGDGVIDLAVGAPFDDDNGTDQGAVYLLFMDANGQVDIKQKISANAGNFTGVLHPNDHFGSALAMPGDINRDGFTDIAVGAPGDDDGGTDRGAVWILNLNAQGQVLRQQKLSALSGNLNATLKDGDQFGTSVSAIGDLDGDGVIDLAVGAPSDNDGGTDRGAIWILFMNTDGTVKSTQKISNTAGSFSGDLHNGDRFGTAITDLGNLDSNGVRALAVGAPGDDDGGTDRGAVWLLMLNRDGTVNSTQKISQLQGQFIDLLGDGDAFGSTVTNLGDLNNDGIPDLGVGAPHHADGGPDRGAFWVLFLRKDNTVISTSRISNTLGNFTETLHDNDEFGTALISLGDLNHDGIPDMATSAVLDDDGGLDRGALWVIFMNPVKVGIRIDPNVDLAKLLSGRGY